MRARLEDELNRRFLRGGQGLIKGKGVLTSG